MNAVTILAVAIWNGLLLGALAALIHWRERLVAWITGADLGARDEPGASGDHRWSAFLAEHPELKP